MSEGTLTSQSAALRRRVERLRTVPTLPRLHERVLGALEDAEVDFQNVAALIEVDQSLASQVLRLANAAFYGSQGRVTTVDHALVVLGTVVTRSIVLTASVLDLRQVGLRGFWEHSLGCAVAAGAIAKVTSLAKPEEVTGAGLLHDLGKVVLYKELPDVFEEIVELARTQGTSFRDTERRLLGTDHAEIAEWLVERWRLPPSLSEPIAFHHTPGRADRAKTETAIVHVANTVVRALGYGSGGDDLLPAIDAEAWRLLGLQPEAIDVALAHYANDLDHALNYALFE